MTTTTAADTITGRAGTRDGNGSEKPIIETIGLVKSYHGTDFRAVDGLDLRVGMGEVYGLLGPNGAGKTTTVGVLTTRVLPSSGQAFVGGIDVVAHPTLAKQMIGVVSQQNTLDRQLTPWENLYFHGRLFGLGKRESKQSADDLLE
jgi:ABC-2 type transport system ATP-binding protein